MRPLETIVGVGLGGFGRVFGIWIVGGIGRKVESQPMGLGWMSTVMVETMGWIDEVLSMLIVMFAARTFSDPQQAASRLISPVVHVVVTVTTSTLPVRTVSVKDNYHLI